MPHVASTVPLVSAPLELFLLVHRSTASFVGPGLAAIPMSSILLDIQPLPFAVALFTPHVYVSGSLPFLLDLHDREWPSGRESRLAELNQLDAATPPMIVVPAGRRRYWDNFGNRIIVHINRNNKVLPPGSVF